MREKIEDSDQEMRNEESGSYGNEANSDESEERRYKKSERYYHQMDK